MHLGYMKFPLILLGLMLLGVLLLKLVDSAISSHTSSTSLRSTALADKLRADVLSQRVEMMAEQFGYRHQFEQVIRHMFMYGHCVAFPETSWTEDIQWRYTTDDLTGSDNLESFAEKAGVKFVTPHPTRVIRDISQPLHDVNNNQGPEWIGYWDIVRYGDINKNPATWNADKISFTNSLSSIYNTYADFFGYYFKDDVTFPKIGDMFSFKNDRTSTEWIVCRRG